LAERTVTVEVPSQSFEIETEVTPDVIGELVPFISRYFILPHKENFVNTRITTVNGHPTLLFRALSPDRRGHIDIVLTAAQPIRVVMKPSGPEIGSGFMYRLKEDLIIAIQFFEENARKSTLYFAWVKEGRQVTEKEPLMRRKALNRFFFDTMLVFFTVFIISSIILFLFLGILAPIVLVIMQFIMVLLSAKIISRTADWYVTEKNPYVHILQYHMPEEKFREFQERCGEEELIALKREIYNETLGMGRELNCEAAERIFEKYGLKCTPASLSTKKVNVYRLVKEIAEKFDLPVPKIAITNTMLPNAAASGPSPKHGIIIITTGLLVQLEEDEIMSVIGHEFGHLKGRDPLILFALTAGEYLIRIYVLLHFIFAFPLLYFLVAMGGIYFISKFFEARADLLSAIKTGHPEALAEALRKIGFRKLHFERLPTYRLQEWIGWDPHPPIYFRVQRLERMGHQAEVKFPLLTSAIDCIKGFIAAF